LSRATSIPAATIALIVSADALAGPSVAIIFVLRCTRPHYRRGTCAYPPPVPRILAVLPLKAFDHAKERLDLPPQARAAFAKETATVVAAACLDAGLELAVVTADERVAAWARRRGAAVVADPGAGLAAAAAAGAQMAQAGPPVGAAEKLQISLSSNPVTLSSGNARLRIEVKDAAGAPVSDAKVEVSAGMAGMDVPKTTARAAKEAGVYEATMKLGMAGSWTVEVTAVRAQGGTTSVKFNLEAK